MNKDFYADLPSMVCVFLGDVIIPTYKNKKWFNEFWNEYREHVLSSNIEKMLTPHAFLKKYVCNKRGELKDEN